MLIEWLKNIHSISFETIGLKMNIQEFEIEFHSILFKSDY